MDHESIYSNGTEAKLPCDMVGLHVLDPNGDVVLVFNSKDAIVSDSKTLDLMTAEEWNIEVEEREELDKEDRAFAEHFGAYYLEAEMPKVPQKYPLGTGDIKVRTSSKHLSLESPYFEKLFSTNFMEGKALKENGSVEVKMEGDPIHGAITILKLLHFNFEMPAMTPSTMMQVSLLADKWDLSKALLYWAKVSWSAMSKFVPKSSDEDVVSWLGIAHVLKLTDEVKEMESLLVPYITDAQYFGNLPIHSAYESVQRNRLLVLEEVFTELKELLVRSPSNKAHQIICPNNDHLCDTTATGYVLGGLKQKNLYPFPASPFPRISVNDLLRDLKSINMLTLCNNRREYKGLQKPCFRLEPLDNIIRLLEKSAR